MGICFVPECKSGYPSQRKLYKKLGKRIPSLFSCKNQDDLVKWNRAIPRADRPLSVKDKVCELHFNVDDIERYYSQKFPDGTTQVLERGKPSLKPGVIPTIFPNLPDRFSKKPEKRKPPLERVPAIIKIKKEENLVIATAPDDIQESDEFSLNDNIQLVKLSTTVPDNVHKNDQFILGNNIHLVKLFSAVPDGIQESNKFSLRDNIQLVKLPNHWWTIHSFPNYVACARWNGACVVDRRVVVKDDNSIKVFLHDIDLQTEERVSCVQDVSYILQKVDDYTVCSGAINRYSTECLGYVPVNKCGRRSTLCKICAVRRKQKLRIARRQHVSRLLNSKRNWYQELVSANRKCTRLKNKVNKLKHKVNSLKSK